MKGFTHFLTGIAIATCFGIVVRASLDNMSMIIVLGGIFGYLPDFLDFQVSRFLEDFDFDPGEEDRPPEDSGHVR